MKFHYQDPDFSIMTPRLHFKFVNPDNLEHCQFIVELFNTPLFISSSGDANIRTAEDAKAFIERRYINEYKNNGYGTYLVYLNSDASNGKPIGTIALNRGDSPESYPYPDIGYAILPDFNGQGYATEAAIHLLRHGRDDLDVKDVLGFCAVGNQHSRRVMEKAGFEFRGSCALACFAYEVSDVFALPHMNQDLSLYGIKNWAERSGTSI